MKFAIALLLSVGTASAYTPPILATVKSKKQQLVQTPTSGVPFNVPSEALPWSNAPATLDGSLIGDVGFDPVGFSTCNMAEFFDKGATDSMSNVQWMREAEIAHGRIAQLAVLGFIIPALVGTFPGNEWTGLDAYSNTNPIEAISQVPALAFFQIVAAASWIELRRVNFIKEEGSSRVPGDIRLGQGEGRFNPLGLDYSEEEFKEKQLQEIKHCRLAMIGAIGLLLQNSNSGTDVVSQLSGAFVMPEYTAKAGYFLPVGI